MSAMISHQRLAVAKVRLGLRHLAILCWSAALLATGSGSAHCEAAPRQAVYDADQGGKRLLIWSAAVSNHPPGALVLFHGGGWLHGRPRLFTKFCEILSRDGLTCISVQYTLGGGDAPLDEAKAAVGWVRANAKLLGIDAARVAVGGVSVGGYLAASTVVLTRPGSVFERPSALVLMSSALDSVPPGPTADLADAIRGPLPPTLILHGTADHLVPIAKTERFVAAARKAGSSDLAFIRYPERGHGAFKYIEGDSGDDFYSAVGHIEGLFTRLGWIQCPTPQIGGAVAATCAADAR